MQPNKLTPGSNIRWESSRMMLPEHVDALNVYAREEKKLTKPTLDQQTYEELNMLLSEAMGETLPIQIKYFNCGEIYLWVGFATKYDSLNHKLDTQDKMGTPKRFALNEIIDICLSEENIKPFCEDI